MNVKAEPSCWIQLQGSAGEVANDIAVADHQLVTVLFLSWISAMKVRAEGSFQTSAFLVEFLKETELKKGTSEAAADLLPLALDSNAQSAELARLALLPQSSCHSQRQVPWTLASLAR